MNVRVGFADEQWAWKSHRPAASHSDANSCDRDFGSTALTTPPVGTKFPPPIHQILLLTPPLFKEEMNNASVATPREVCSRIVNWIKSNDLRTLATLCLTSKAFHHAAEPRLYHQLYFTDSLTAYYVCQTIASCDRIALHVKTFWTLFNERRWNSSRNHLNPQFWDALHLALRKMHNLQVIAIGDPSCPSAWIFRQCQFQLQEAELRMDWDADLVRFLDTQSQLQSLRITNPRLSSTELDRLPLLALSQGAFPSLRTFDGSLIAAVEFVSSPITHLQVSLGQDGAEDTGHLLKQLAMFSRTLTSISVIDLPYSISVGAFDLFSLILPHLRHVGIVPLPFSDVSRLCLKFARQSLIIYDWSPRGTSFTKSSQGSQRYTQSSSR